jgi:serine/threonine protein kinase
VGSEREESRFQQAEAALAEYLVRVESGEELSFELWRAERPEFSAELERLHAEYFELCEALGRDSPWARLRHPSHAGKLEPIRELEPAEPLLERLRSLPRTNVNFTRLGTLGRGGMGEVLAIRDEVLRRELAMKVLRESRAAAGPGQRAPRLARFLEEAQIMAQLDHPGIVPVHELGVDEAGRPFLTMKRVRGQTLAAEFARLHAHELRHVQGAPPTAAEPEADSLTRCLTHLLRVCEALAYAHERGVIHRDLKPSNVMLGSHGEVHVMDWGLARVLALPVEEPELLQEGETVGSAPALHTDRSESRGEVSDSSAYTHSGQGLGTAQYMPPEQAAGHWSEVDKRADVYAVGAMLYHLLAGHAPYGEREGSAAEVQRRVIAGPPVPLHHRAPRVPMELVSICEKAMARRTADRYPDMKALAEDLAAYVEGRVVRAYETGAWAEARKWVRRNKPLAAALLAVVVLLVVGLVTAMALRHQAVDNLALAKKNEEDVLTRADELQKVSEFQTSMLTGIDVELMGLRLREDVLTEARAAMERSQLAQEEIDRRLDQVDSLLAGTNFTNVAVRGLDHNVLQRALKAIDEQFAGLPRVQARLLAAVAESESQLGLYDTARELMHRANEIQRGNLGNDHPDTITSSNKIAGLLRAQGRFNEAEALYRDALERRQRILGDDHSDTVTSTNNLAMVLQDQGKLSDAEGLLRDALVRCQHKLGDDHPNTIRSTNNLAGLFRDQGKLGEAEALYRDALERCRRILGDDHPNTIKTANNFAGLFQDKGNLGEAEALYRDALERRRRILGDDHPDTITSKNNLAMVFQAQGKLGEAEALYRDALDLRRRILGNDHPGTIISQDNLAGLLMGQGKFSEAEALYRDALERCKRILGEDHSTTISTTHNLAVLLKDQSRLSEAEPLYRDSLERRQRTLGNDHHDTLTAMNNLAVLLRVQGRLSEAEPLYRDTLARRQRTLGADHPATINSTSNLAVLLKAQGRLGEAEPLCRDALERRRRILGNDHRDTLTSTNNLAVLLHAQGKLAEAEPLMRDTLERRQRTLGEDHPDTIASTNDLVELLDAQGKHSEAELLTRNALERNRSSHSEDHTSTIDFTYNLAKLLADQSKLSEAETLYRDALARARRLIGATDQRTVKVVSGLAELLDNLDSQDPGKGHAEEAARLRREFGM